VPASRLQRICNPATTSDAVLVAVAAALSQVLLDRGEYIDPIAVTVPVSGRRPGGGQSGQPDARQCPDQRRCRRTSRGGWGGGTGLQDGCGRSATCSVDPTWAKLVRTLAVEFGQDGAFVVG
jgi:hypothetical protein